MKECFTCKFKLSRDLSKKEITELQLENIEKTGRKTLLIPTMEFKCEKTGKVINQTDSACEMYKGDELMENIRKELSLTAKMLRKGFKK